MRTVSALLLVAISALAQPSSVRILNTSRPGSGEFQVGDRFEIFVRGSPKQPISVRTTMARRMDWGPIIGSTDNTGRWFASGRFEKGDFGDWSEAWTVGGRIAAPILHFSVQAPCLSKGDSIQSMSGPNSVLVCETPEGRQTFSTPSDSDPFRTPDGRSVVVNRRAARSREDYQMNLLQHFICSPDSTKEAIALQGSKGGLGDRTADLILMLIGVNALNATETRNVLALLRRAFAQPETITPSQRMPAKTERLIQRLKDFTDQAGLHAEIDATAMYVRAK